MPDTPAVDSRETRVAAYRERIKQLVDEAPELTEEQLRELSKLLAPPPQPQSR